MPPVKTTPTGTVAKSSNKDEPVDDQRTVAEIADDLALVEKEKKRNRDLSKASKISNAEHEKNIKKARLKAALNAVNKSKK
jgi:hypothetical protein